MVGLESSSVVPAEQLMQIVLDVAVAAAVWNWPGEHVVMLAHVRSEVVVGATT